MPRADAVVRTKLTINPESLGKFCLSFADHLSKFVCLIALCPKSTAMVMAGRSVHLSTFFPGQAEQVVNQYFVHILSFVTDNNPS